MVFYDMHDMIWVLHDLHFFQYQFWGRGAIKWPPPLEPAAANPSPHKPLLILQTMDHRMYTGWPTKFQKCIAKFRSVFLFSWMYLIVIKNDRDRSETDQICGNVMWNFAKTFARGYRNNIIFISTIFFKLKKSEFYFLFFKNYNEDFFIICSTVIK